MERALGGGEDPWTFQIAVRGGDRHFAGKEQHPQQANGVSANAEEKVQAVPRRQPGEREQPRMLQVAPAPPAVAL